MTQHQRTKASTFALFAIAALLLANLAAMLSRSNESPLSSSAFAQRQAPIAGGAGLFVMPAQLSGTTWGCYLIDVDRGTLCVYQFNPGNRQLQFVAARGFTNDRRLMNFNTAPSPQEIGDLADKEARAARTGVVNPPEEDAPKPKDQ